MNILVELDAKVENIGRSCPRKLGIHVTHKENALPNA
jgi:hypothetical protein